MTTPADPSRPAAPTVGEIAELTARLREISARGRDVDPAEREQFLADKDALIARITDTTDTTDTVTTGGRAAAVRERYAALDALSQVARARAEHPGYVLVGPSARTWLRDPVTGRPAAPVGEAEHRAVRELLGREVLDTTEPEWVTSTDGQPDVHSTVVLTTDPDDADGSDGRGWDTPARWEVEMPDWMGEQTARTQAQTAAGTAPTLRPEEPVALAERIGELRAAHGPSRAEEVITARAAVERLTALGHDQTSAQTMVTQYLHEASRAIGVAVHQWGLNGYDVDAIAEQHSWVLDGDRQSLPLARERPSGYAQYWTEQEDPIPTGRDSERLDDLAQGAEHDWDYPRREGQADAAQFQAARPETVQARERAPAELGERYPLPGDDRDDFTRNGWGDRWTEAEHDAAVDYHRTAFLPREGSRAWTEQAEQRHRAIGAALDRCGESVAGRVPEQDRREQLARWHTEDQTTEHRAAQHHHDDAPDREPGTP